MSAVAALRETRMAVDPGAEVATEVTVLNTGSIVEQFGVDVVGVPESWVTVEPPVLSLFPNAQQVVTVRFHPPRSYDTRPGPTPYAVRIVPSTDSAGSVAEEGVLEIAEFLDLNADLAPTVVQGRLGARVHVAVDSRGNYPLRVRLTGNDPAGALQIRPRPVFLDLMPNEAAFSSVRLRPHRRHLTGAVRQTRFRIMVDHEGGGVAALEGTMIEKPLLPRLALAALVLLALAAIWLFIIRPVIRNTATAATQNALSAQQARTNQAAAAAAAASANANSAAGKAASASKAASALNKKLDAVLHKKPPPTTSTTTTTTTLPSFVSGPYNNSLEDIIAPGSDGQVSWRVPTTDPGFALTDLVLDSLGPGSGGDVRVQLDSPGASPKTILEVNLAQLSSVPFQDARFQTPITMSAGQSLALNVVCLTNTGGACDVGALFSGSLTSPAPPPPSTTTTTTSAGTTGSSLAGLSPSRPNPSRPAEAGAISPGGAPGAA